jgi:cytoskeletal protein RodZ
MSSSAFGEHLKREREMRGVSLEEISAVTRISTRFLDALENGRWEQLPGGAFNRGFIRATARFLGLDEDSMVSEYALETGNSSDSYGNAAASAALPRDWKSLIVAIGIIVVVILVVTASLFAYHRHRLRVADRLQNGPATVNVPEAPISTPAVSPSPDASPADTVPQPASGATPAATAPAGDSH